MIFFLLKKYQQQIFVSAANTIILLYSIYLFKAPFLENRHAFSLALQQHHHSIEIRQNVQSLQLLVNACTFNILACLFDIFAATVLLSIRWKWAQFLTLFASFLLFASCLVVSMSLLNIMNLSSLVALPENLLVYHLLGHSFRGSSTILTNWLKISMIFGLMITLPASVYNVLFWKERLTSMLKRSIKIRQSSQTNLHQREGQETGRQLRVQGNDL